ncbi:MAG: hypothetical protein WDN28_28540 [Chthoniobacter sp.]
MRDRRIRLSRELASVDAELAEWTSEPSTEEKAPSAAPAASVSNHRDVTLAELIAELAAAPNRTLNIRKAHLESKSIKALAKAHPDRLRLGGKGAWPTVTLLERAVEEATSSTAEGSQQEVFTFRDGSADAQAGDGSR